MVQELQRSSALVDSEGEGHGGGGVKNNKKKVI